MDICLLAFIIRWEKNKKLGRVFSLCVFSEVCIHLPRDFEGNSLLLQSFLTVPIKEENQESKREYRNFIFRLN